MTDSAMSHLAVRQFVNGSGGEVGEHVSDELYLADVAPDGVSPALIIQHTDARAHVGLRASGAPRRAVRRLTLGASTRSREHRTVRRCGQVTELLPQRGPGTRRCL
jgi:hypothetical protein